MKKIYKFISVVLIITVFSMAFPLSVFAEGGETQNNLVQDTQIVKNQKQTEAKVIGEIIEKREQNVKHFLKEDGTFEAATYPVSVHYLKDGKWEDIDNTLNETLDENNETFLENRLNSYKVRIAKKAGAKKLVSIKKDGYELSWGLESGKNHNLPDAIIENSSYDNELFALTENERKKIITKLSSKVSFNNIFNNIDLQYEVKPDEVKESIILHDKNYENNLTFRIKTQGLFAEVREDRSIMFYDKEDRTKEIFSMSPLFMYDAKGELTNNVDIDLTEDNGDYLLRINPDFEWLNSPEREYPVVIDPSIKVTQNTTNIKDTYVYNSYPDSNYSFYGYLKVASYYLNSR